MMLMIAHDRPRGTQMLREKLPNDELLLPEARPNNVSVSAAPALKHRSMLSTSDSIAALRGVALGAAGGA